MAMKWDGFSEEDINKMKLQSDTVGNTVKKREGADLSQNGCRNSIKELSKRSVKNQTSASQVKNVKETQRMESVKLVGEVSSELEYHKTTNEAGQKRSQDCVREKIMDYTNESSLNSKSMGEVNNHNQISLTAKLVVPSLSQPPLSSINLNEFKTKHRLMEEQNRARKVFLAKALEDRKKQTHAEQLRLSMIQEELQKLDQRLSCDVSVIRNQIEAASVEFMEAQKRYDRAEKEFLDAKLLLYTKLERKELLTHHLCTIIEQNEMRKAQKLSELMEKLEVPDDTLQSREGNSSKEPNTSNSANAEPKRKISSEIILTPSSVVPQSDVKGDVAKLSNTTTNTESLKL